MKHDNETIPLSTSKESKITLVTHQMYLLKITQVNQLTIHLMWKMIQTL